MDFFNATTVFSWISGLIFAFFAVTLFTNTNRTSVRCYSLIAITCAVWSFSQGIFYLLGSGTGVEFREPLLLFFSRMNHFSAASTGPIFFYFSLLYPEGNRPKKWILYALLIFETVLAYAYFIKGEVIHDIFRLSPNNPQYGWNFGTLGFLFHLQFIPLFLLGTANLYRKYRTIKDPQVRPQLAGVIWATALGAILAVMIAIVLPLIGDFTIARFAPLTALIWVAFMSYAIFRYHALPVKIIGAEVAVFGLVIILFGNIFLQNTETARIGMEAVRNLANIEPGEGVNIYSTIIWVAAIIIASFGLIISLDSTKKSGQAYAVVAFLVAAWATGTGAFLYVESYEAVMRWAQFNHYVAGLIAPAFFYFAYLFPGEKKPSWKIHFALIAPQVAFLPIYLFTTDIIYDTFSHGMRIIDRGLNFGPLGYTFHASFIIFFTLGFLILFRKARAERNPAKKRELNALAVSSLVGVLPAGIVNLLLPTLGYFGLYWIGPIGTLVWVLLSAYVIVRYHVLSTKLVFAEASVLALGLILFINVFLSENASFGALGRVLVFMTFSFIGGFFIRSIIRGDDQTEILEKLSSELADLNQNLTKKVEERTREIASTKTHVETIIENLTSGLIEYTSDFTVLRLNRTAERILGVRREDVVGSQFLPHSQKSPQFNSLSSVLNLETSNHVTTSNITITSPLELELQVVTAPLGKTGTETGFIKVIRDVTRERLIARSKSEFISIAAHQLRTPLSIIKWTLSVLLEGDKGVLPPVQQESLSRAYTTNERMIGLVNDLLDVARIEDGRFGYEMKRGTIVTALEEAVHSVAPLSEARSVRVALRTPQGPKPEQTFDPAKIVIAFRGLIDNAIRYTQEGGSVSVDLTYTKEHAVVTITDTGIGIPEAQVERLFTKFYRSENAIRLSPDGSGLALFIVKNIIDRHGGTTLVQSKEAVGTTVTLQLPLNPADIPTKESGESNV